MSGSADQPERGEGGRVRGVQSAAVALQHASETRMEMSPLGRNSIPSAIAFATPFKTERDASALRSRA